MPRFTFFRGDTIKLTSQIFDSSKVPFNLTGAKVWFTLKRNFSDTDLNAVAQITTTTSFPPGGIVTITDAINGKIAIKCPPTATLGLIDQTPELIYDIQIMDALGDIMTPETGIIAFTPDVTKAIS